MTTSVPEFVKKIDRLSKAPAQGAKEGVFASALVTVTAIRAALGVAMRGKPRLQSASTGGGRNLGVGFNVKTIGGRPVALISARGAFQLIERDTKPHDIGGRRGTLTAKGRVRHTGAQALHFGNSFYARVSVSGTQGKHPFDKGIAVSQPRAAAVFHKAFDSRWLKALQ